MRAPDGTEGTVRRLWLPGRRWKSREAAEAGGEVAELVEIPVVGIVFGAIALFLLVIAVLPLPFLALELLALPALFAYRVLLGKPWTVEARSGGGEARRWQVGGWRRAGETLERIAAALERGEEPVVA